MLTFPSPALLESRFIGTQFPTSSILITCRSEKLRDIVRAGDGMKTREAIVQFEIKETFLDEEPAMFGLKCRLDYESTLETWSFLLWRMEHEFLLE